jgi:Glyoxalase superfamily protein
MIFLKPNLDYLKKQAKDRLARLRQQSRTAKLADAQHALAREYGFRSWAALKAHVESLAHNYRFER